jgi:uncharacterized phage-associated protein/DNA-binding transcriptional regulator YiaG
MKSPFTGGKASTRREIRVFDYRKESFSIMYHYYQCEDTQEQFTTTELDTLNINQVHNKYRAKYGIPFVDEIRYTREKYALSAAKMSEVLGLGANVYRNYESGEMPSVATGRLIRMAEDPSEFNKLLALSRNVLEAHDFDRVQKKLQRVLNVATEASVLADKYIFRSQYPDEFNGYRKGNMTKLGHVVRYLAATLAPFVTGMNKLLFYVDFRHYQQYGRSITGISYKAIEWGPVPRNYGAMYNFLVDEQYIAIEEREVGEMLVWKDKIKLTIESSPLEEEEINTIEKVVKKMKGKNTRQIVDMSHEESAWKENVKQKAFISYEYSFLLQEF